jgi:hypothetical protein
MSIYMEKAVVAGNYSMPHKDLEFSYLGHLHC